MAGEGGVFFLFKIEKPPDPHRARHRYVLVFDGRSRRRRTAPKHNEKERNTKQGRGLANDGPAPRPDVRIVCIRIKLASFVRFATTPSDELSYAHVNSYTVNPFSTEVTCGRVTCTGAGEGGVSETVGFG